MRVFHQNINENTFLDHRLSSWKTFGGYEATSEKFDLLVTRLSDQFELKSVIQGLKRTSC